MKIAICDDEYADLELLSKMIYRYRENNNMDIEVSTFSCCTDVLAALCSGVSFDLIFFDILMPGLNGLEAAKILRETNSDTSIVFTTNSRDFAIDAFTVKAKDYILKPVNEVALFALLDDMGIAKPPKKSLMITTKNGFRKIYPHQLVYCEVLGRTILWHLSSGAVVESAGTMQKTVEVLESYGDFFQIHRAFLVNFRYISEFRRNDFTVELAGMNRLPVPKAKFVEALEGYKRYIVGGGETK